VKPLVTASMLLVVLLPVAYASGQTSHPSLSKGVISYTADDGRRKEIRIARRCADLWVAPDESVIAFIAITKVFPGMEKSPDPFIVESSLYIARKADGFRPIRVYLKRIVLDGEAWKIVRCPSVSPDHQTVYFSVPYTMKDWKLISVSLRNGAISMITDHVTYCVVWGGRYSGDLFFLKYVYEPTDKGLQCFVRDRAGSELGIDDPDCGAFTEFAARWSRERGGTCSEPPEGLDSEEPAVNAPEKKRP
jgi:hypothetical protein